MMQKAATMDLTAIIWPVYLLINRSTFNQQNICAKKIWKKKKILSPLFKETFWSSQRLQAKRLRISSELRRGRARCVPKSMGHVGKSSEVKSTCREFSWKLDANPPRSVSDELVEQPGAGKTSRESHFTSRASQENTGASAESLLTPEHFWAGVNKYLLRLNLPSAVFSACPHTNCLSSRVHVS